MKSAFMASFAHATIAALKRRSGSKNLKLSTANIACSIIGESRKIFILINATVANISDDIAERCITTTVLMVLR